MAFRNEDEQNGGRWWWLTAALVAVLFIRLYGLSTSALSDYDSYRNWLILQEMVAGDFRQLFHHGSPGFYLIYAPVAWLTPDFRVYQHLNAGVGVAAIGWLAMFVAREARLQAWHLALLVLLTGSSVFLTFAGRDFSASSWSLLLFTGLLTAYYRRLHHPTRANLLWGAGWLALGLTINYKTLLCLPILAVLEFGYGGRLLWKNGNWKLVLLLLAAPYVVFGIMGMAVGLQWYRWPAVYYNLFFPGAENLAGRTGQPHFHNDWLYYLRFLLDFESPLTLLALLAAPLAFGRRWRASRQAPDITAYLAVWVYCFLAGMSLLLKAPRGLLLIYAPLYLLAFLVLQRFLPARWLGAAVVVAVLHNLYRVQHEVYAYSRTSYPQVATWLRQQQVRKIGSTVGMGIRPFLPFSDSVAWITDERQLTALSRRGYQYVLLDAYWRPTGVAHFDSLRRQVPTAAWREPALTSPLLFLEHSEYTGLSYEETLARQQAAAADPFQLRLHQLTAPK